MAKKWKGMLGKGMEECCHDRNDGFVGRVLLVTGVLIALNQLGMLVGVSVWVKVLIGAGFALTRF